MPLLSFIARTFLLNYVLGLVFKRLPINPKWKALLWPLLLRKFPAGGRR